MFFSSPEMRGMECCVKNCGSSSHDHLGRTLQNGLSFHCVPAWRMEEGPRISELTKRRRAAWLAAVGREDITFDRIPSSMRVCSKHFVSGKPAYEMLETDPDWVPSLLMGQDVDDNDGEGTSCKKEQRLCPEEKPADDGVVAEVRRPPPPPWKEVKSALQSLLEIKTVASQRPRNEEQNRAAGMRSDISFREFFRNALESSLEASIQARARAKSRTSSAAYEVKLNFKLPSPEGEPGSRTDSSSSCTNCSGMLRRIEELERKLFVLASKKKQREEAASPAGTRNSSAEDDELTGYIEPVEVLDDGSEAEPDSEAPPPSSSLDSSAPSPDSAPSTSRRPQATAPRRRHRFRKEWLKDFPFLRYSPALDLMWCHVCRVYSDQFTRNHRLIKGSNTFVKSNITQHTISHYHQQNMQRFVWSLQKSAEHQSDQGSQAGLD